MITVNDIAVEFGGTTLFSDVTFAINENDKIALMGKNGAGKSTLLKIVAGESKATRGSISAPSDAVIAYLPQHLLTSDNCTVMEEASKAFAEVLNMKKEIDDINEQLTIRTDYESDAYMKLIERVSELSEKFYAIEEVNYEAEVEKVLKGLGFEREDFTRLTKEFSGAEIEQVVIEAMRIGFNENREFDNKDMVISIQNLVPLARTKSKELDLLKEWSESGNVTNASKYR